MKNLNNNEITAPYCAPKTAADSDIWKCKPNKMYIVPADVISLDDDDGDVEITNEKFKIYNIDITDRELRSLGKGELLFDVVIACYFEYLSLMFENILPISAAVIQSLQIKGNGSVTS